MCYITITMDSVITAIKNDIFTVKCALNFINFIITVYSDKKEFFANHLLKNIDLFKKFSYIINHIYFPENNFNFIDKKNKNNNNNDMENFIFEKVLDKYDINKYLIKTKEDFSLNSDEMKNNIFHTGINSYIKDDPEMLIFMKKYLEEKNSKNDLMLSK